MQPLGTGCQEFWLIPANISSALHPAMGKPVPWDTASQTELSVCQRTPFFTQSVSFPARPPGAESDSMEPRGAPGVTSPPPHGSMWSLLLVLWGF